MGLVVTEDENMLIRFLLIIFASGGQTFSQLCNAFFFWLFLCAGLVCVVHHNCQACGAEPLTLLLCNFIAITIYFAFIYAK